MTSTSNFSWFDLNKYAAVETFDIDDWYYQLQKRQWIHLFAKETPEIVARLGESRWKHAQSRAKTHINSIKEDPIFTTEKLKHSVLTVRNTDYDDLYLATIDNQNFENILNSSNALNSLQTIFGHKPGWELVIPQTETKSTYGKRAIVTIDLCATDEQLKKEFSEWLDNQRKIIKFTVREKRFTAKDLEKWTNNKVLPYLDLTLIAIAENIQLTQNKIGRLLFPDEFDVDLTERIRRSVKPLAEWLIDKKNLEAIRFQAKAT